MNGNEGVGVIDEDLDQDEPDGSSGASQPHWEPPAGGEVPDRQSVFDAWRKRQADNGLYAEGHTPRPDLEAPRAVHYAEQALALINAPGGTLSPAGRAQTVRELVSMLASDTWISPQDFTAYLRRLEQDAPAELSACARGMLEGGQFFLAPNMNPPHAVLPRLCEVVRLQLMRELGLQDAADLLKLEIAVEALGQGKLLIHRAMFSHCDFGEMSEEEAKLREKALRNYQVFNRLVDELRASTARRKGRPEVQAVLSDRNAARATVTDLVVQAPAPSPPTGGAG